MNRALLVSTVASFTLLFAAGCNKSEPAPSAEASSHPASTSAPASTTAPATAPAKSSFVQKGLKPGDVAVGYLKPTEAKDEGECVVVGDKAEKKDDFKKHSAEVAKMLKATVVDSCPTENVVGTCTAMGMANNYYGPKWTKDTAKADCEKENKGMAKWFDY